MKVLITGGSGLVGSRLTEVFQLRGFEVVHLSTSVKEPELQNGIEVFPWNPSQQYMHPLALRDVDVVVHLAGASIAKKWTPEYKKEIINSRIASTRLLYNEIENCDDRPTALVSASASGYYPNNTKDHLSEEHPPGDDFLSVTTSKWEEEVVKFDQLDLRVVRVRIGFVLSLQGGALPELAKPTKILGGTPVGSGKQFIPWIHIDDLSRIFLRATEDEQMSGVYNAGGPTAATNAQFMKVLSKKLHRPYWGIPVPAFILKLVMGENALLALASNAMDTHKIRATGFEYIYPTLSDALDSFYDTQRSKQRDAVLKSAIQSDVKIN
jgi:uncharacterized protein (TIGR01777 family)